MASMSHSEMVAKIQAGEGILHEGRVITTISGLPKATELARGNPAAEAAMQAELKAQMADLQAQMAALKAKPADKPADDTGKPADGPPTGTTP